MIELELIQTTPIEAELTVTSPIEFVAMAGTVELSGVISVNGEVGVVVLDADDISDTTTDNKFVTADDLTTLSNTSGTNTGDQDLSGYSLTTHDHDGVYEPADATILKAADIGVTVQSYNANTVIDADYVATDNNFTDTEKTKLSGIEDGAEVNVNADWDAVTGDAEILNKPTLFSGDYDDLTNKPTLFSGSYNDLTDTPTLFSGSYNDLTDTPTIPTALSDLSDDTTHRTVTDTEKSTWNGKQDALGFTPEDVNNKEDTTIDTSTTKYPTVNLLKSGLDGKSDTTHDHSGIYEPVKGEDDNYVTDAEKIILSNTSGTNTGDQDLSGYSLTSHNHSGVYEPAFSKNTAFNKNFGTGSSDVCVGNDSRLSNARTPTSHDNTYHSATYITASSVTKETLNTNGDVETTITNTDDKFPTSGAVVDYVAANASSGKWVTVPGTPVRIGNTSFRITGDYTSIFDKKVVLKWTDTTTHCGMVVSSSYSSPNTTITIIGDVLSATATMSSVKYCLENATVINFAVAGNIGATGTDVANKYYADEAYRVLGADLTLGTAGTTNSTTIDINKNGSTMFTTKPSCGSTVATDLGNTADDNVSLALSDYVTIDVDAICTTPAVDLYVKLFVFPTKFLSFS